MKEEQKVSFIHSISAKIMLLTVLAVVMSVLIVAFRAEAGAKKVVGDVSADYILSMAEMGVEIVNNLPQEADAGAYENALADISMEELILPTPILLTRTAPCYITRPRKRSDSRWRMLSCLASLQSLPRDRYR